jgi:hypothetical protein
MEYRSDLASAYKDQNIELRPDGDPADSLDEVIAHNIRLVHLERMGDNAYWLGIDLEDGRHLRVNFWTGKRALLKVNAEIEGPDDDDRVSREGEPHGDS